MNELNTSTCVVLPPPCSHTYHEFCLMEWFKQSNKCPTCRYELKADVPTVVEDEMEEELPVHYS